MDDAEMKYNDEEGKLVIDAGNHDGRLHNAPPTPPYSLDPLMRTTPVLPHPAPYNFETAPIPAESLQQAPSVQRTRVCKLCKFTTSDAKEFRHHQMQAHSEAVDVQQCGKCDFVTSSVTDMETHARTHRRQASSFSQDIGSQDDANNNEKDETRATTPLTPVSSDKSMDDGVHYDSKESLNLTKEDEERYDSRSTAFEKEGERYDRKDTADPSTASLLECRQCGYTCDDARSMDEHKKCHHIGLKNLSLAEEKSKVGLYDTKSNHSRIIDFHQSAILPAATQNSSPEELYRRSLLAPDYSHELFQRNFVSDLTPPLKLSMGKTSGMMKHSKSGNYSSYSSKPLSSNQPTKSKSTCTPVREAVDPAKYVTIREPDGVKYACSKCGNIYKWRKSLNKHWKEKHDGEIPELRNSFTPLTVPRLKNSEGHQYKKSQANLGMASYAMPQAALPSSLPGKLEAESLRSPALSKALKKSAIQENGKARTDRPVGGLFYPSNPLEMSGEDYKPWSFNEPRFTSGPLNKNNQDTPSPGKEETDPSILDLSKKNTILPSAPMGFSALPPQDEPLDFSLKSSKNLKKSDEVGGKTGASPVLPAVSVPEQTGSLSLQCPSCAYIGRNKQDYDNHMELHLRKRHYKCAECQQVFFTINELNKHFMQSHLDMLQNKSAMGGYRKGSHSTPEATQLFKYLTMDSSDQLLSCVICGAIFQWQWTLAKHFEQDHPTIPNPYRKRPADKAHDQGPKRTRIGDGDFQCSHCALNFTSEEEMHRHQAKHSEVWKFSCKFCEFSTRAKVDLLSHYENEHPGSSFDPQYLVEAEDDQMIGLPGMMGIDAENTAIVIPQAPEECDNEKQESGQESKSRSPTSKSSSKVSRSVGNGEGENGSKSTEMLLPFKCDVCEYRARWPSEISQHKKNHSDEKPFLCPRCSYRSKWKWDVVKHLKRCGGGTVKDVIDTTKGKRPPIMKTMIDSSQVGTKNVSKASSREHLSNGPPNVTVMPTVKPAISSAEDSDDSSIAAMNLSANNSLQEVQPTSYNSSLISGQHHYCPQCPFVGNSPAELKRHSRVHSDEKPFICKTCGYSSKWKCDLKKHLRTYNHTSAVPLTYGGHGRKPSDLQELEKYMDKSDASSPGKSSDIGAEDDDNEEMLQSLACEKCDFKSHSAKLLDAHVKMHQARSSGKHRCKSCSFETHDLSTFLQHKLSHQGPALNSELDGGQADIVPRHRRKPVHQFRIVQSQDGMYSSDDSGSEDSRNEREFLNEKGTMFSCEWCNWSCEDMSVMYSHACAVHPVELGRQDMEVFFEKLCQQTKMSFAQSLQLRPTSQTDSDDQDLPKKSIVPSPFHAPPPMPVTTKRRRRLKTCHKCGYITDNMTTLQRHLSKHGGKGKFTCSHCDYSVDRQHILQYHVKTVHNGGSSTPGPMSPDSDDCQVEKTNSLDTIITQTSRDLQSYQSPATISENVNGNLLYGNDSEKMQNDVESDHSLNDSNHENINPNSLPNGVSPTNTKGKKQKLAWAGAMRKYRCQLCPRTCATWAKFLAHQASHKGATNGGSKRICPECGHKSTTKKLLNRHMKAHRC